MEYTVKKLAGMSGVSARTLRYYDQIGLLKPGGIRSNGYRVYGRAQVDLLQQILFYRELGFSLEEIGRIAADPAFDLEVALSGHLAALESRKQQIECLIETVRKTIAHQKGATHMNDKEKFEGFKKGLITENEKQYGAELRQSYGEQSVEASHAKLSGLTEEEWRRQESLSAGISDLLLRAMKTGDPAGEAARALCELHKEWLLLFWPADAYSKEAHKGLGELYAADERFRAYYDKTAVGAADFLRDALSVYCGS